MSKAVLRKSERIYNFFLQFYPKSYRQEFGEEMKYVFSESLKDAYAEYGDQGIFTVWIRTIIDTGKSLVIQHLENQKGGDSMKIKNIIRIALVTLGILLIPFVAMQFTSEVKWNAVDFITMGTLIFGTGLAYELIARRLDKKYRLIIGAALLGALLIVWVDLAVGIFNIPGISGS